MFYTHAEKWQSLFFGDWRMRTVAFDTRRRYLYYSEPVTVPPTTVAAASALRSSPALRAVDVAGRAQPASLSPAVGGGDAAHVTSSVQLEPTAHVAQLAGVVWRKKIKVCGVVPVATVKEFKLNDANLSETDLYQLEIIGEVRPMATGEMPPVGPLLCPSAGLQEMSLRCSVANAEFIEDPFFLKELFNAMRDQFEELEREKNDAEAAATASGRPASVPPATTTLTITSPRGPKDPTPRKVKVLLRCRDERDFRRFWYVLQTVLGFDKLITRPYRGLPPYDPRNMVSFAHIPMTVWHTFKALDKAVFYIFTRGDVMGIANAKHELTVSLHGCYMCVTHDMVYFMRDTGNIPRWIRLQEVAEFHYNTTAKQPFFVFLSDPPVPDVVFVPLSPVYGPRAVADYDPVFEVHRMQRVMHDTVFASLAIRRVIRLTEVTDSSLQEYTTRMQASSRPLRLHPGATYSSAMSCPLPKEQLAAVWHEVQQELRVMGDIPTRAAIPLYEANAPDLQLSGAQLTSIEQHLDDERERRDEVVGMPLERARRVPAAAAAAASSSPAGSSSSSGRRRLNRRRADRDRHPRRPQPSRANGHTGAAAAATAPETPAGGAVTHVMPLTAEMLNTPQLVGTYQRESQPHSPDNMSSGSSSFVSRGRSEFSSYLVPGTRYITREEAETGGADGRMTPAELEAIGVDNHQEVERGSTVKGVIAPSSPLGGAPATWNGSTNNNNNNSDGGGGGFRYGPERTVNEIVSESLAALQKQREK